MPIIKWKNGSSEGTVSQLKKNQCFKNNHSKNIADFNLEIRPISSSSSSFGTESFLSYDSIYDGERAESKYITTDVNENKVMCEEIMDFQEPPVMQSEEKNEQNKKESFLKSHGNFSLDSKMKMDMGDRQMFFTSMEEEENGKVNNFFYKIGNMKKSNKNDRCDSKNICSLQQSSDNGNFTSFNEKSSSCPGENKNEKLISSNPTVKDKCVGKQDRVEVEKIFTICQPSEEQRLRGDQFNKVSPLIGSHKQRPHIASTNSDKMSRKNQSTNVIKTESYEGGESDKRLFSPIFRENWIMFEDDSSTFDKDSSSFDDSNVETKLIVSSDENESNYEFDSNKQKPPKENITTKSTKNIDETKLIADGLDSELSDEVISLDYESEEERKKLCDTPVKQFPDIELFRASSAAKRNSLKLELNSNETLSENHETEIDIQTFDNFPDLCTKNTWNLWYRYPDRKKKVGSRKWSPVSVTVERDFIKVNGETKNGSPIVREIPLHPFYVFTLPRVHAGNREGKMFSVKLQYVKYKEIRKLKMKTIIEHLPIYTPVIKLATRDFIALREFIEKVETIIRHIPTYRDKGITYRHEEIFIDCDDECQYLVSGDGNVLKSNITVQMRLRVFITGNPELKLYLNDLKNKETLMKLKEGFYSGFKSHNNWINPINYEFHPCVDTTASTTEGGVIFLPPDGCSFELLRFRVPPKNKLPIITKSTLEVSAGNSVRLMASIQVNGDAKSIRHKRSDVTVYFPIPSSWNVLFLRSRSLNGKRNYIKVNASRKTPLPSVATLNRVTLKVSAGIAKYEPAFGALVWKLGTLPIIQNGLAADAVHTFECFIELPFALEMRDEFQPFTYVEFNVGHQLASGVSVEEILVSDGKVPDKWVCYRANYRYKVSMRLLENGKEKVSPCR